MPYNEEVALELGMITGCFKSYEENIRKRLDCLEKTGQKFINTCKYIHAKHVYARFLNKDTSGETSNINEGCGIGN